MKKLSELVNSAIEQASSKVAAAAQPMTPPAQGQSKIAHSAEECPPDKSKKSDDKDKTASVVSTATEAVKFAQSLENLSMLWPKLAGMETETYVSPDKGKTQDTSTTPKSIPSQMASTGGAPPKGIETATNKNEAPYAKKAAEEILSAKLAQAEALLAVGRAKEAEAMAKQAKADFEAAKKAYEEEDGSTRTPKGNPQTLPVNRSPGDLPVPSGPARDNQGMINMTKRDAKTKDVRESASQHLSEPALSAATDKGLTDNLEHTEGAKIATIMTAVRARASARAAS